MRRVSFYVHVPTFAILQPVQLHVLIQKLLWNSYSYFQNHVLKQTVQIIFIVYSLNELFSERTLLLSVSFESVEIYLILSARKVLSYT